MVRILIFILFFFVSVANATLTSSFKLQDGAGNPISSQNIASGTRAIHVYLMNDLVDLGYDARDIRFLNSSTDSVSISSIPLATGAATSANQVTANSVLANIYAALNVDLSTRASEATLDSIDTKVSTAAKQDVSNGHLSNIASYTQDLESILNTISGKLTAPIDVSVNNNITGYATSAAQISGNSSLASIDSKTPALGQALMSGSVPVTLASNQIIDVNIVTGGTSAPVTTGNTGDNVPTGAVYSGGQDPNGKLRGIKVTSGGIQVVEGNINATVISSVLPTGAATSALQTAGNAFLNAIENMIDIPLSDLAKESTQTDGSQKTQLVDPLSNPYTNGNPLPVSGAVTLVGGATSAKQDIGNASLASIDSKLTNPLPISASALPLPSGAATSDLQTSGNSILNSILAALDFSSLATAANQVTIDNSIQANGVKLDSINSSIISGISGLQGSQSATTLSVTSGTNGIIASVNAGTVANNAGYASIVGAINSGTSTQTAGASGIISAIQSAGTSSEAQSNSIISAINQGTASAAATGAEIQANQQTQIANENLLKATASATALSVASIDSKLTSQATAANQTAANNSLSMLVTSGASTATFLSSIDSKVSTASGVATFAAANHADILSVISNLGIINTSIGTNTSSVSAAIGVQTTSINAQSVSAAAYLGGLVSTNTTASVSGSNGIIAQLVSSFSSLISNLNTNFSTLVTSLNSGSNRTQITNPAGTFNADVAMNNRLRVTTEPSTKMADKFDGATLDPIIWTSQASAGGAVNIGTGNFSITTGTATGARGLISTVPKFNHPGNAFIQFGAAIKLETGTLLLNTKRQWGFVDGGNFTYANPFTDGVMFEITETGELRASVYNTSVRTFSAVVSAPTDGGWRRYDIFYNTMNIAWYINGALVAQTLTGENPVRQTLPGRIAMLNNTVTGPASAPTLQSQAIAFTDTASNNKVICDPTYGFRCLRIDGNGAAKTNTKTAMNQSGTFAITVTTTAAAVISANTSRGGLILTNDGAFTIYCTANGTAVAGQGITLQPGVSFNMNEYSFFTGGLSCITATGTAKLNGAEFTVP